MATLEIQRSNALFGYCRKLKIKIGSDITVGIKSGDTQTVEICEGSYSVQAWMDWGRSVPLQLTIKEGETKKIYAGTVAFLMTLISTFIPPFHVFTLEEVE